MLTAKNITSLSLVITHKSNTITNITEEIEEDIERRGQRQQERQQKRYRNDRQPAIMASYGR